MAAREESAASYMATADQRPREELARAEICRRGLGLRAHALAGSVSQAEKAAEGRALELLRQLELTTQRAAAADHDRAIAIVRGAHEGLQDT